MQQIHTQTHPFNQASLCSTHLFIHPHTHVDIISVAQLRLQARQIPMASHWPGEEELISAPGPSLGTVPWLFGLGGRCHAGPQCGPFQWPRRAAFRLEGRAFETDSPSRLCACVEMPICAVRMADGGRVFWYDRFPEDHLGLIRAVGTHQFSLTHTLSDLTGCNPRLVINGTE